MKHDPALTKRASPLSAAGVFSPYARDIFAECYPDTPHKLRHTLGDHPLLGLDALIELGDSTGEGGDAIRNVMQAGGRTALRNIEQYPAYCDLLHALIDELRPDIESRTGRIRNLCGHLFFAGPNTETSYHFDPRHGIMLQLTGSKVMTLYPVGDPAFASDQAHEACHTKGTRDLEWRDELAAGGIDWRLVPGDAVYVPAMAPHHAKVGSKPSVSLSLAWRSAWSQEEADARAFNSLLRRIGIEPQPPERWPEGNKGKALGWRAWRRFRHWRR